jgi:hypothetical protein
VKDVQGLLRHSRAATTTDVYMQEIPESVEATVNAISARGSGTLNSGSRKKSRRTENVLRFVPNATNRLVGKSVSD